MAIPRAIALEILQIKARQKVNTMRSAVTNGRTKGVLNISGIGAKFGSTKLATAATRGPLIRAGVSTLLLIAARSAEAQTERVLYSFAGGSHGSGPDSRLTS